MREIKFRGKRIGGEEWIYGSLLLFPDGDAFICFHAEGDPLGDLCKIPIDPITIGQFTGCHDKNKNDIYEGDYFAGDDGCVGVVEFCSGAFVVSWYGVGDAWTEDGINEGGGSWGLIESEALRDIHIHADKVLTNIHDNPRLTEKPE